MLNTIPEVSATPSPAKRAKLRNLIGQVLLQRTISYHALQSLIGKLSFLAQCHPLLRITLHELYHPLNASPGGRTDPHTTYIPIPPIAPSLHKTTWMLADSFPGALKRQLSTRSISLIPENYINISTDASGETGYAIVTPTGVHQEHWSPSTYLSPIHYKELYAIYMALSLQYDHYKGKSILFWTDN